MNKINSHHNLMERMLATTNANNDTCLFLLIDLCDMDFPLLSVLSSRFLHDAPSYWLLFEDTPEAVIKESGPILLALDINNATHMKLLETLCEHTYQDNRLLGLNSHVNGKTLAVHLRQALQLQWEEKEGVLKEGILRYYTPNQLEVVNQVFTPPQHDWFHQYTRQWFWVSQQGYWRLYQSHAKSGHVSPIEQMIFTAEQYEELMLWAEILSFRRAINTPAGKDNELGEKALLKQIYILAKQAEQQGIYSQDKRNQLYIDTLGLSLQQN